MGRVRYERMRVPESVRAELAPIQVPSEQYGSVAIDLRSSGRRCQYLEFSEWTDGRLAGTDHCLIYRRRLDLGSMYDDLWSYLITSWLLIFSVAGSVMILWSVSWPVALGWSLAGLVLVTVGVTVGVVSRRLYRERIWGPRESLSRMGSAREDWACIPKDRWRATVVHLGDKIRSSVDDDGEVDKATVDYVSEVIDRTYFTR